jgi:hypothetical protein
MCRAFAVAASLDEFSGAKLAESLAGIVILNTVPYFTIRVLTPAQWAEFEVLTVTNQQTLDESSGDSGGPPFSAISPKFSLCLIEC